MINLNTKIDYTSNEFSVAIKELQIGRLLRKSNIRKSCGVSAYEVFQFLLLLSDKVSSAFSALTRPERVKVLILDDSVIKRNRSKAVNCLPGYMTMQNTDIKKDLRCSPSDDLMATAFCR